MKTKTNENDFYLNQYKIIHYLQIYNLGKIYWLMEKQHLKHNNLQTHENVRKYLLTWQHEKDWMDVTKSKLRKKSKPTISKYLLFKRQR